MALTYFSDDELKDRLTGQIKLQAGFGEALDNLRTKLGQPMAVTSCCRSTEHNKNVGGHPTSLHLMDNPKWKTATLAIDIAIPNNPYRAQLVQIALNDGWSVGVGSSFVHLDIRTEVLGLQQLLYWYTY